MSYYPSPTYGITLVRTTVGLSSVVEIPAGENQVDVHLRYVSGGTVYISGTSLAVGTGTIMDTGGNAYDLHGYRGPLYLSAAGATSIISWYKLLSRS